MSKPIVFYDIPANVQGTAWSSSTWKTRFTLNYKHLPYETVWVEFPDIARTCQEIGASPTSTWPDGSPKYTLPVIYDPSTGTVIAETTAIARYLDTTYPDTPRVIPEGTEAFHEAFRAALRTTARAHFALVGMPLTAQRLHPVSAAYYFKGGAEKVVGGTTDGPSSGYTISDEQWTAMRDGYGKVAQWLEADGKQRIFFMGEKPSLADFTIGAALMSMKAILGKESDDWRRVEQWHGGRWAKFLESLDALAG